MDRLVVVRYMAQSCLLPLPLVLLPLLPPAFKLRWLVVLSLVPLRPPKVILH
jgi:hypothetical protein